MIIASGVLLLVAAQIRDPEQLTVVVAAMLELVIHGPLGRHVALNRADHGRSPVDGAIAIAVDEHDGCFGRATRAAPKSTMPDLRIEGPGVLGILARALGERERATLQGLGGWRTQQGWKHESSCGDQKTADG